MEVKAKEKAASAATDAVAAQAEAAQAEAAQGKQWRRQRRWLPNHEGLIKPRISEPCELSLACFRLGTLVWGFSSCIFDFGSLVKDL